MMAGTPIPTRVPLHEIYFCQHDHRLIDPKQRPLPRDPSDISPTDLLQAKYEIVPYVDNTGMKADLIAWCGNGSRATAGRLVHGAGGLGKTRLMIAVAAALRAEGWMAGFFDRPHEQLDATLKQRWQALDQLIAHGDDKGLLIVMDYAEGRQEEVRTVVQRISRRPEGDTRPVRLVLLARSAGDWWTALHDEIPEVQSVFRRGPLRADVVSLSDISAGRPRRDLFLESAKAFSPTLAAQGKVIPNSEPSQDLVALIETGAGYGRPLAVQMQALLWLFSAEQNTADIDILLQLVLGLERSHWGKLLGAVHEDQTRDMARGVAQVTLIQGTSSLTSSERLLMADQFYHGKRTARVDVDPIIRNLARVYGKPDGGLAQLEPDLIGEHHVAMVGDVELVEGCLRWIETEPSETTREAPARSPHGAAAGHAAGTWDAGQRTGVRIARSVDHAAHQAARRRYGRRGDGDARRTGWPPRSATRHARRRGLGGDRRRAATAIPRIDGVVAACRRAPPGLGTEEFERAVDATADLPPEALEDVLSHLAARIDTLGIRLSDLGRREEALAATQEAVDIHRRLAQSRPDAFLPDLAVSLNNLGTDLSDLGRREEALAAAQEAVDIYRRLAQSRPDAFLPDLARSLNNLGNRLSDLGRREEALAAAQEAVDIHRRLAQSDLTPSCRSRREPE